MEVTVLSGDRDLLQLATEHIRIRLPKTKGGVTETENYNTQDVIDKYQVASASDYRAESRWAILLTISRAFRASAKDSHEPDRPVWQYRKCLRPCGGDQAKPAKNALQEHYDMAVMSKALATINTDCDYDYDWDKAKLGNIYTEAAYA